jgi:hypothetical protein
MVHGQICKKPIFGLKTDNFLMFFRYLVVNLFTKIFENLDISKIKCAKAASIIIFWLLKNGSRLKI